MRQGNNIQLSVQLLGCILIAKGAKVEQKQRQRYLEFVNSIFPPLHWQHPHCHLGATLELGEAKGRPYLPIQVQCCGHRDAASITAEHVGRVKKMQCLTQNLPRLTLRLSQSTHMSCSLLSLTCAVAS